MTVNTYNGTVGHVSQTLGASACKDSSGCVLYAGTSAFQETGPGHWRHFEVATTLCSANAGQDQNLVVG